MDKYRNRREAGRVLAKRLQEFAGRKDVIVLALPRGGVPVAYEIAKSLHLPLDVFIVRKLGVPGHEELAMGAIGMNGSPVFNQDIIEDLNISAEAVQQAIKKEKQELSRRDKSYRGERPFPDLNHKIIILVDDGIATGATVRSAISAIKQSDPASIVLAVPVADAFLSKQISQLVDQFICPLQPTHFYAVGAWYDDFSQTEDAEVHTLLNEIR